jgi:3-oxoacyl-[acyl-carrier-protein] synthase-3
MGTAGRGLMTVEREPGFEDRLLEVAAEAGRRALDADDIDPDATVLIASTPTPKFPQLLAETLGIGAVRTPDLSAGDPHTASLPLAYHRAVEEDSLIGFGTVLFVAAGAGPSGAAAVYRLPVAAGAAA